MGAAGLRNDVDIEREIDQYAFSRWEIAAAALQYRKERGSVHAVQEPVYRPLGKAMESGVIRLDGRTVSGRTYYHDTRHDAEKISNCQKIHHFISRRDQFCQHMAQGLSRRRIIITNASRVVMALRLWR